MTTIKPLVKNFVLYQGTTFKAVFNWQILELPLEQGCIAAMQLRATIDSAEIISTLTTENGKIIIDPVTGNIELKIPASETETFTFAKAVYDLELEFPNEDRYRIAQGQISLNPEVTRGV